MLALNSQTSRPYVRKTPEQIHDEYIQTLVQDKEFHQPTLSYLAKCNNYKLPILCEKCLDGKDIDCSHCGDSSDDNSDNEYFDIKLDHLITNRNTNNKQIGKIDRQQLKSQSPIRVGSGMLKPRGLCEYDEKLCILYNRDRPPTGTDNYSPSPNNSSDSYRAKNAQSAPLRKVDERNNQSKQVVEETVTPLSKVSNSNSPRKSIVSIDTPPRSRRSSTTFSKMSNNRNNEPYNKPSKSLRFDVPKSGKSNKSNYSNKSYKLNNNNKNNNNNNNNSTSGYNNSYNTNNKKQNQNDKKTNETTVEPPMCEGDIRYSYTSKGLEIKRLSTKNWLVIDIFTDDVCQDQNEKSYAEWLNRQREDENRANQKYPSQIYEKQLKELLDNWQRGAITHSVWARQSYEVQILKQKIKRAKQEEEAERRARANKAKEKEAQNVYNLWKIKKEFSKENYKTHS